MRAQVQLQQKARNTRFAFPDKAHAGTQGLPLSVSRRDVFPPSLIALISQVAAAAITLVLLVPAFELVGGNLALIPAAFIQGGLAAAFGRSLGLAPWWMPMNMLFAPALAWTLSFGFSPLWFLAAFLLLFLAYWNVFRSQVPLYLSSRGAWVAVADLLPKNEGVSFLDVGAGLGGMLGYLSMKHPGGKFCGLEIAPLPFLLAWLRKQANRGGYRVIRGDFWAHNFEHYDVVYAYLSPVPMAELWAKACDEMAPGACLVSNTFAIPGVDPEKIIELDDFHSSRLFVYRIPAASDREVMP